MRDRIGKIGMECEGCGLVFSILASIARSQSGRKYCSYTCSGKRDKFGTNNPNWRGGRSNGPEGRGLVYARGRPGANISGGVYMLEYRMIVEQKLGRQLRDGEIVHHINGDRHDNRPENLQVMDRAEHAREHFIGCSRPDMSRGGSTWKTIRRIRNGNTAV